MMNVTFHTEQAASANIYARLFCLTGANAGYVFDFADNTWKSTIAAATTPQVVATEKTIMGGTTKSGFLVTLDLDNVAPGPELRQHLLKWYNNGTPAAADESIEIADSFFARFGRFGNLPVEAKCEVSHTSAAGSTAHIAAWLECGGELVTGIDTLDASATVSVVAKELTAGTTLFTKAGTVADLVNDVFTLSQSSPAFVSDRQYILTPTIVIDGVTFAANITNRVVIG